MSSSLSQAVPFKLVTGISKLYLIGEAIKKIARQGCMWQRPYQYFPWAWLELWKQSWWVTILGMVGDCPEDGG